MMNSQKLNLINKSVKDKEEVYNMISDIFVAEGDMKSILEFCKKNNARVTFRDAGADSIRQLKMGAGAKPHSILEKSIKESRLTDSDKQALVKIVGKENLALILGLVGRWSKSPSNRGENTNKSLKGLYLTNAAAGALKSNLKLYAPIIKPPNNFSKGKSRKNYFLKLALTKGAENSMRKKGEDKVKILEEQRKSLLKKDPKKADSIEKIIEFERGTDFEIAPYYVSHKLSKRFLKNLVSNQGKGLYKYLFAGDYDLHDLFTNKAFAQGSNDEKRLLEELNKKINSGSHRGNVLKKMEEKYYSDYNMIQHGAQEKYMANMRNNERGKEINPIVAQISKNALAACSPDGWKIIKGYDKLSEFYKKSGLTIKQNWNPKLERSASSDDLRRNVKPDFGKINSKRRNSI